MINLENDKLVIHFPHLHEKVGIEIEFKRTLRVEEDRFDRSLPPDLGNFKVRHIEDIDLGKKEYLKKRGGVLIPMSGPDALWLNFRLKYRDKNRDIDLTSPVALKVAAGKICAVSGKTWKQGLSSKSQNYVVIPDQPWLDGFKDKLGSVRQFVAAHLGDGLTVEEKVTGKAEVGGIQIEAYPLKEEYYNKLINERAKEYSADPHNYIISPHQRPDRKVRRSSYEIRNKILNRKGPGILEGPYIHEHMEEPLPDYPEEGLVNAGETSKKYEYDIPDIGLAPGGNIIQEIYRDRFGSECWDTKKSLRCFVTLANELQWMGITGEKPPVSPISPSDYKAHNVKWHDHYGEDKKGNQISKILGRIFNTSKKE